MNALELKIPPLAVMLLCAFSLPILGSVIAVVLAAARLRTRYADLRSGEGDA